MCPRVHVYMYAYTYIHPFQELSNLTAFKREDVKATLERLQLLNYVKGQWIININPRLVEYWLSRCGGKGARFEPFLDFSLNGFNESGCILAVLLCDNARI